VSHHEMGPNAGSGLPATAGPTNRSSNTTGESQAAGTCPLQRGHIQVGRAHTVRLGSPEVQRRTPSGRARARDHPCGTHNVGNLSAPPPRRRRWAPVVVAVFTAFLLIGAIAGCSKSKNTAATATTKPAAANKAASPSAGSHTAKGAPTSGSSPAAAPSSATPSAPRWSLVTEPNDGMQPIYSLMSNARDTLDMTMYELADPTAVSILEADARRGVRVRVLLDRDYSGYSINQPDLSQLASNAVQVRWAPAGTIFHQKTITIDDRTSAICCRRRCLHMGRRGSLSTVRRRWLSMTGGVE